MNLNLDASTPAFSTLVQPSSKAFCKALWRNAKTGLHFAFGDGQCIVKFRCIGEISHAELIEPIERTCLPLAVYE